MSRVTNEQLKTAIDGIDERLRTVETILMTSKLNKGANNCSTPPIINPTVALIIRFIVFPLIVIVGTLVGAERFLLGG